MWEVEKLICRSLHNLFRFKMHVSANDSLCCCMHNWTYSSVIVRWLHRQHKTKNSVWPKQRYKFARICPSAGFVRWCYQYLCNGNTVCFEVERSLFRSCSPMKSRIKVGWWRDTHFCRPCSWRHRFRLPDTKWRRSWPCFRDFESLILNNLDHHSTEKQPGDFCFVLIHSSR